MLLPQWKKRPPCADPVPIHHQWTSAVLVISFHLSYHLKYLNRLEFPIYQKYCSASSVKDMSFFFFFFCKTLSDCASIAHPGVISLSRERMSWTHACIFMLLLLTVHTDARANTIALTILPSLAQAHTCTRANSKAAQSINIFTLQTFTFQVNHPLFILCQYSSFPPPLPLHHLLCVLCLSSSPGDSSSFPDLNSNHITASKISALNKSRHKVF